MKWNWPSLLDAETRLFSESKEPAVWIFGYGSLIWKPGFAFDDSKRTVLHGYRRAFWQGNTSHRGTKDLPGRVATISECPESAVLGLAFRVSGLEAIAAALDHLQMREINSGYVYQTVRLSVFDSSKSITALTVVAKPGNPDWIGNAHTDDEVAEVISKAVGPAGPNTDYLFNLTAALRSHFPETSEPALDSLEQRVRVRLHSVSAPDLLHHNRTRLDTL